MKIIYVILMGLVMFNFMLMYTEYSGIFPGPNYQGREFNSSGYSNFENPSAVDLITNAIGGLNPLIMLSSAAIFALSGLAAWICKSPVPLGIGGFAAFFTGVWGQTYSSLNQFSIPGLLLAAGTFGIGILLIINVIEMAGMRQDG